MDLNIRRSNLEKRLIKDIYDTSHLEKVIENILEQTNFLFYLKKISPSLYQAYTDRNFKSEKNKKIILDSVAKYLLRMSYSTTPFSFMGMVSSKKFETNRILINPSLKWLSRVKKMIEDKQSELSSIELSLSPSLIEVEKYYFINVNMVGELKKIKIKKNTLTGNIIKLFKIEKKLSLREILKIFNDNPKTTFIIIKSLLDYGVLVSELSINSINNIGIRSITNSNFVTDKAFEKKLSTIHKNIEILNSNLNYNQLYFEQLYALEHEMKQLICDTAIDPVNISHFSKYPKKKQPINISTHIEECIPLFRLMSVLTYNYQIMWKFEKYFSITYGKYSEVRLKEAFLDDNNNFITSYLGKSISKDPTIKVVVDEYKYFINKKIQESILMKKDVIEITGEDIKKIEDILIQLKSHKNILKKIDFKFKYILNEKKYYIPSLAFSYSLGGYLGKFPTIDVKEKDLDYMYDIEYVANYVPDIGATYNNTAHKILIENPFVDSDNNVSIDDLVIGIDIDGLYLKNLKNNRKIIPTQRNLIDYHYLQENPFAAILSDLGNYLSNQPAEFIIYDIENYIFIPRIQYKDTIFSKKTWIIDFNSNKSSMSRKEYVCWFIDAYKVDNNISLLKNGKEFPIDINTKRGMSYLLDETSYLEKAILVERFNDNSYEYDYITSLNLPGTTTSIKNKLENPIHVKVESSDYQSFTFVCNSNDNNIIYYISNLLDKKDLAYFFVRYIESGEDVIRFRIKNLKDNLKMYIEIINFFDELVNENEIKKYSIIKYYPEVNRYGGFENIGSAEEIFEIESKLFKYINEKLVHLNKLQLGMVIEIDLLLCAFTDSNSILNYFEKNKNIDKEIEKEIKRDYKKNRNFYKKLFIENIAILRGIPEYKELRNNINRYVTKCKDEVSEERLNYILDSLLHMRINRFCGIDSVEEIKIFYLAKLNFYNLQYYIYEKEIL